MESKTEKGKRGELLAERVLRENGYEILEKNFRSPFGEIDIVAKVDDVVVFIEVKRRDSKKFGSSLDALSRRKIDRIIKTAKYYIKKRKVRGQRFRFDVVGIDGERVRILKNAFSENSL